MYFPEISSTLELLDLSKNIGKKISQLDKKFDNYNKNLLEVWQTRDLLADADNSIHACLRGDDVPVWTVLENIKHLLNSGVKNGT